MSAGALSPAVDVAGAAHVASGEFDVVVVGGGIVGAGAALDAATRGLSVALLEAQDFASGSSSRSSKLIHGGLRYLQMHDFALVREALSERAVLVRIAPHLVRPLPILFPLRRAVVERAYVGAGVGLYDLFARATPRGRDGAHAFPRHRQLSRRSTRALAPALAPEGLAGAIRFYDAQVDDARYVVSVVRTAGAHGAVALSRTAVTDLVRENGRVVGVRARRVETGETFEVRARAVVSATGVWSARLLGHSGAAPAVQPSKGVHLVIPGARLESQCALILPTERSVLFVLPFGAHWIVGTTDTPWSHDLARPAATAGDVDYLLAHLNAVLSDKLTRADVQAVYAGLRPLIATGAAETTKLSREHAVSRPAPGLVVVSGGKYTTYRVMARDAIDAALNAGGLAAAPCRTDTVTILGGRDAGTTQSPPVGIDPGELERLFARYGTLTPEVLAPAADNPDLLAPVGGYLAAEVVYAVTHEGARHLDDVLERRTHLALETPGRGADVAEVVAAVMAPLLGWDAATSAAEVDAYRAQLGAARAAEETAEDAAAAAVLAAAPPRLAAPPA